MIELTIRLVASLAVVVGLMLLLARVVGKRYGARAGAPVQVLHRQPLSRSASVAVISVGGRVLVVGTTDQQVSLLTELDPDELAQAELAQAELAQAHLAEAHLAEVPSSAQVTELSVARRPTAPAPATPASAGTGSHRGSHRARPAPRRTPDNGALAGSVLSPQTWRQALAAAAGKAS